MFSTHPMNATGDGGAERDSPVPAGPRELHGEYQRVRQVKARLIGLENGKRLGGGKNGRGPVLLHRTGSSGGSDTGQPSGQDDDRPVLRSGKAQILRRRRTRVGATTADAKDDGHPTLKNNTSN